MVYEIGKQHKREENNGHNEHRKNKRCEVYTCFARNNKESTGHDWVTALPNIKRTAGEKYQSYFSLLTAYLINERQGLYRKVSDVFI